MPKNYILAIDQGTTSSRAIVFDRHGGVAGSSQQEFSQIFPQPGWVEHDPLEILRSTLDSLRRVLELTHLDGADVAAIGIANQRETAVVWDRHSGQPVHNAVVWQSRQSEAICERLREEGHEALIREKTGLPIDPYFSASKIRWILDHVAGASQRAIRGDLLFGTIDSWLIWNLTGGRVHVTDPSNASRTQLFNIHTRSWDDELLKLFSIPAAMLPRVASSSEVFGHTDPERSIGLELPLAGVAGDQQAALFGQACFKPGMVKNTYGTGCFMLMNTGSTPVMSRHGLLTTVAWDLAGEVEYALEGSIFVAGSAIQWLRDGLGLLEHACDSQAMAESVSSTDGVYLVPAFVGLGAPYWCSDARGAIFGLSRGTRREHLVRAALESMAYQTRDVVSAMESDAGTALVELRADGGAILNDFLARFQSDVLGVSLVRPRINETTALGVAYLAGLAVGFWRDREQLSGLWQLERRFEPQMPVQQREQLYGAWRKAVEATMAFRFT